MNNAEDVVIIGAIDKVEQGEYVQYVQNGQYGLCVWVWVMQANVGHIKQKESHIGRFEKILNPSSHENHRNYYRFFNQERTWTFYVYIWTVDKQLIPLEKEKHWINKTFS